MNLTRARYQQGSLTIEKRKNGASVWVYRWREADAAGTQIRRKKIIGTKAGYPSKAAAMRAVEGLRLDINSESAGVAGGKMTIQQLAEHYRLVELAEGSSKTPRTKAVYKQHLDTHILPRWGSNDLGRVKAFAVEDWLKSLQYAPATKAKIRNVFSALYAHAMRYGWAGSNPISQVRQSAKRQQEPDVLTPAEVVALLSELGEPSRTIVLLAATTGLRRSEVFGLKWSDVDFERREIRIVRSLVDQVEGEPKTIGSKRPMPMHDDLAAALRCWRSTTPYDESDDWVFASPDSGGQRPYWPSVVLNRHIKPAALRAEIPKAIGWHTFRRSFATLLVASGANVKTAQELMRHASPTTTTGIYAQAVNEQKREAQSVVAALFNTAAPVTQSTNA